MTGRGKGEAPEAAGGLARHAPVLLPEVLGALTPQDGERYIDCTFGAGGYSRAILAAADCHVLALDRDPGAYAFAERLSADYPYRFQFAQTAFSDLSTAASANGFDPADGVVFDLGVSSMQLDAAERGFSFMRDGPLDMRMAGEGESAADVVNSYDEAGIAEILFRLGEEKRSRAIAKTVVRRRKERPFTTTLDLADTISGVLGRRHDEAKHPATRSFQALRLFVNDELGELVEALASAEAILRPGGRLAAVTFHSLEDRIVKSFLVERSGGKGRPSRHLPDAGEAHAPSFKRVRKKPIEPSQSEVKENPRARSARLRSAVRLDAPPWPVDARSLGLPMLKAGTGRN